MADYPTIFYRGPSSLVAHEGIIPIPSISTALDYEAELALVIGKTARNVSEADALQHVFAYTCFNDGSFRDYQRKTTQWTVGKNFDATGGFGPALVTADELGDPANLNLELSVNGELRQRSNTNKLVYDVPRLIEYASAWYTLHPGDIILTGTPEGVGPVKPGDVIHASIERVGSFDMRVASQYAA